MSEELVQLTGAQNGVVAYNAVEEYDETGLDSAVRLKPANIILVQNTTRDPKTARPGQLLDLLTEEVYDSITIVPLKVMKQRVMFPPGSDLDADSVCNSNDGIVPSMYANVPQSATCASCPHSQWINGKKSACADKLKLLYVIKDKGIPRTTTFGGNSITALRSVLQRIKEVIRVSKANGGEPLHLYDFFFTLKGVRGPGTYVYYVARFENVKRLANIGEFGPVFEEFVIQRKYQQAEEDAVVSEAQADQAVSEIVTAEFVPEV